MKNCVVIVNTRDNEGNINGYTTVECQTPDDGLTAIMPMGLAPGIEVSQPGDITIRVATIADLAPVGASVVVDYEAETQNVAFIY